MIERVAYCVIYAADLERMTHFYHDLLHLPIAERSEHFVAFGGAGAPLAIEVGGPPSDGPRAKDRNPTLIQFAVSDIERSVMALQVRGILCEGDIRHGPFGALAFFRDPEGNRLALLSPAGP